MNSYNNLLQVTVGVGVSNEAMSYNSYVNTSGKGSRR